MHVVTLLQKTISSSLGIGTQTQHLHHSGFSSAGGSGSFGSLSANFFPKSRLPLPILEENQNIVFLQSIKCCHKFPQIKFSIYKHAQGCALTAPGHLRQPTFGLGRLKKNTGHQAGHPALLFAAQHSGKAGDRF